MKKIKDHFRFGALFLMLVPFLIYSMSVFGQPTVKGISPLHGPAMTEQGVEIRGTGFTGITAVYFGNALARSWSIENDHIIKATPPIGVPGVVDVTVSGPNGTSPVAQDDRYAFQGDWTAFLPDFSTAQVYTTDTTTNFLNPQTIEVENGPISLVPSMDGKVGYCVNSLSHSISVIDLATQLVTGTIPLNQSNPILMAVSRDMTTSHDIGYTINFSSNTVSQIDLTAGSILQTVNVGLSPKGIILNSAIGGTSVIAYAANSGSATISRIDFTASPPTVTTINTNVGLETGSIPSFIALAPDASTAYFIDGNPAQYAVKQLLNINTTTPSIGQVITSLAFNFGGSSAFPQIAIAPPAISSDVSGEVFAYVTNPGSSLETQSVTTLDITDVNNPVVTCSLNTNLAPME